jgi:two-component system, OmpR family, sensor histidine kinase BaeS
MFKSLWIKFLFLLLSVSLISLSAALILRQMIIDDFNEYLEGMKEDRIYRIMAVLEGSYEKHAAWNQDALEENAIWALLHGYEVKLLDSWDKELMNTQKAVESLSPLMKKRIIAVTGFSLQRNGVNDEGFTTYPLFLAGKDIGSLEIRTFAAPEEQGKESIFLQRSNRFLFLSVLALGGLSVFLSLVFSRRLTGPIKKLTAAAKDISEGNIKTRVSISGNDEISTLAQTFNTMAGSLEVYEALRRKLTANIAHELRTPLSAMQGELEAMIDGLIKNDAEHLLSLHEETGRLKKLIEGIEELSKAEASILEMKRQKIVLKPFLSNIQGRFGQLFRDKGVTLQLDCEGDPAMYADPDKVSQIVINLLSNAMRVTDKGGRVTIKAGEKGDGHFIEVADTGSGIRKEDLPFVFERFYRAHEGGLGLGLAIARELADAHGGRIEVRSEYGKGSSFTLVVPNFTTSS